MPPILVEFALKILNNILLWYMSTGSSLTVALATVTSSLPPKDLNFRPAEIDIFLPRRISSSRFQLSWRAALYQQLDSTSRCLLLHFPRWSASVLYTFLLQCLRIVYKIPFVCECLGRKIPFAEFKCERENNLKLQHVYSFVYDKWKKKYIHMFRFRSYKNSEDICVDESKNLSNIMDI
jgi:hypothetical protein